MTTFRSDGSSQRMTRTILAAIIALLLAAPCSAGPSDKAVAIKLLRQVDAKLKTVHSLSADVTQTGYGDDLFGPMTGHVDWKSPGYFSAVLWFKKPSGLTVLNADEPHRLLVSDSKTNHFVDYDGHVVTSRTADVSCADVIHVIKFDISYELTPSKSDEGEKVYNERWDNASYRVIALMNGTKPVMRLYIGRDRLVHRIVIQDEDGRIETDSWLTNLRVNQSIPPSRFVFKCPTIASTWPERLADERTHTDAKSRALLETVHSRLMNLKAIALKWSYRRMSAHNKEGRVLVSQTSGTLRILTPDCEDLESTVTLQRGIAPPVVTSSLAVASPTGCWESNTDAKGSTFRKFSFPGPSNRYFERSHTMAFFREVYDSDLTVLYQRWLLREIHYVGKAHWHGELYDVIAGSRPQILPVEPHTFGSNDGVTETILIGGDGLIHRQIEHRVESDGIVVDTDISISDVDLSPKLTPADFTFTPPPGAKDISTSQGTTVGK